MFITCGRSNFLSLRHPAHTCPRGSFIVRGEKKYLRVPLRLAIGVVLREGELIAASAPPSAASSNMLAFVVVEPGDFPAEELSKRIKEEIARKLPEELKDIVPSAEDFRSLIPYGRARMSQQVLGGNSEG